MPVYRTLAVVFFLLTLSPSVSLAQRQIVTDHFYIYFGSNAEQTARRVADVAEEVFNALASSFDFYEEFSRIHILVHDEEDFSNGFANYYENRVEIWASDLDFPYLRGTHDWIKLVVTHELAHIVSLKVASKGIFNAMVIQSGQFNRNPDFTLSLPWLHLVAPNWYVEGIAQLADDQIGYEAWDTHRDMLLRMATLENELLTYSEMGVFSHGSMGSELVYNQGYGFLRYIRDRFGPGKAEEIAREVGYFRFDATIKKVLGVSASDLYRDWREHLRRQYGERAARILSSRLQTPPDDLWKPGDRVEPADLKRLMAKMDSRFEGEQKIDQGSFDLHPAFSPDGRKLAYLSNGDSEFAITTIWILDLATGRRTDTGQRCTTSLSWTPDSRSIVYARQRGAFYEIHRYNVASRETQKLSANLRVRDPQVSPDGQSIVFVRNSDGTTNLGLMRIDGTSIRYLTNNNDGTIYYTPRWSPDGKRIAFSIFRGKDRDIGVLDADGPVFSRVRSRKAAEKDTLAFADTSRFVPVVFSTADERDPVWLPDGSGLVYSSDRDGVFNLYEIDLSTGAVFRRSDALGGAFMASVSPDGARIAYAGYHASNYSIYEIDRTTALKEETTLAFEDRDFSSIQAHENLSDVYTVGNAGRRWAISGIVPIIGFSQTFIGDQFGLNAIDLGAQISLGDVLDRDRLFLSGSVGLNFRHKIDPNLNGTVFYERQLPAILSKSRSLAPSVYAVYDRSIINNLRDRTSVFQDTSAVSLIVQFNNGVIDTVDGVGIRHETFRSRDTFKFDFNVYALGLRIPLSNRQILLTEYARRSYRESFESRGPDHIRQQFYIGAQQVGDIDTTIFLSGRSLDDTRFFSNSSTLLLWNYRTIRPTVDAAVNPTGGRDITLWFRRLGNSVTDSLLAPTERIIDGRTVPIENNPNQFPLLSPVRHRLNINELGLSWTEFIRMPMRHHTLTVSAFVRYQDKRLREAEEGGGFYWPLRIYLGGLGSLSGYPYFTLSGSKVAFTRVSYTLPLFPDIHRRLLFFYLDRLYLSGFWETGTTWNFDRMTADALKSSRFLHDVGVQLRMQVFTFYRVPMVAFAHAAFPLTRITDRSRENLGLPPGKDVDDFRLYFGLGF